MARALRVKVADLPARLAELKATLGTYPALRAYVARKGESASREWLFRRIKRARTPQP